MVHSQLPLQAAVRSFSMIVGTILFTRNKIVEVLMTVHVNKQIIKWLQLTTNGAVAKMVLAGLSTVRTTRLAAALITALFNNATKKLQQKI